MSTGQTVYVENGGYYTVNNIINSTTVDLYNLDYPGNAIVGAIIASSSKVSPAGIIGSQGLQGATGYTGPQGAQGAQGSQGSQGTSTFSVIVFGGSLPSQSVTGTYYLIPGGASGAASSTSIKVIMPYPTTLTNFKVMHNTTSTNVNMNYTVTNETTANTVSFTVNANTSTGSNSSTLSVSNGDQLTVKVQWGSTTGVNLTNVVFSMRG
jgi:hypothetical protein